MAKRYGDESQPPPPPPLSSVLHDCSSAPLCSRTAPLDWRPESRRDDSGLLPDDELRPLSRGDASARARWAGRERRGAREVGCARGGVGERWGAREVGWAPGEGRQPAGCPADVGYAGKRERRVEGEVPTGVKSRPHARGGCKARTGAQAPHATLECVERSGRAGGRGACNGVQWRGAVAGGG